MLRTILQRRRNMSSRGFPDPQGPRKLSCAQRDNESAYRYDAESFSAVCGTVEVLSQ